MTVTFDMIRRANVARLPQFKNAKGEPAHSRPDGSDWSLGDWMTALTGEVGEAANLIKKVQRRDVSLDDVRGQLAHEFADVLAYLDILAFRCGVDLGAAYVEKFNIVSDRVGSTVKLDATPEARELRHATEDDVLWLNLVSAATAKEGV